MDERRITLDRTNLQRLAEVMRKTPNGWTDLGVPPEIEGAIRLGWDMAVESLERLAEASPELYGDHGWPAVT